MEPSNNDLRTPHKAARAAMGIFGERYSQQRLGINDYYDQLTDAHKDQCRLLVRDIDNAPPEGA